MKGQFPSELGLATLTVSSEFLISWNTTIKRKQTFADITNIEYGPLVRIAPDEVSSSDPKAIPKIYPIQRPLEKTDWYLTYRPVALGGIDAFTDDNEKHHTATRKIVGSAYTLTSMLKNEGPLDDVVNLFMEKLGEFADQQTAFNFGEWLEM